MTRHQLENFILYLQKENWLVFGPEKNTIGDNSPLPPLMSRGGSDSLQPQQDQETILINLIEKPEDLILDNRLPFYPWKRFFVPEKETLFEYKNERLTSPPPPFKRGVEKTALIGINILDLQAINLYDQVFERDPYYQQRRRNTLIIGHSLTPQIDDNLFEAKYEEDILEHLPFDIFLTDYGLRTMDYRRTINPSHSRPLDKGRAGVRSEYKIFSGSIKGQRILEHFGYKNYEHIQFSGPIKEGLPDKRMELLRDKLKNHHNQKIWDELGQQCIECGKCTVACPTCFCFRVSDRAKLGDQRNNNVGDRERCWDSCYYAEFSEVSGGHPAQRGLGQAQLGHKFLSNTASRIHFWYFHKFARIPDEFNFMGCVGCRRCAKVCPVDIDIAKVLKEIEAS